MRTRSWTLVLKIRMIKPRINKFLDLRKIGELGLMVVLNATINQRFWSLYVLRIRTGVLLEPFGLCSLTITGVKDPHYLRFASDPKISANVVELPAWLFNYLNCPSTVDIKAVSEVGIPISTSDL